MNSACCLATILTVWAVCPTSGAGAEPPSLTQTSQLAAADSRIALPGLVIHGGDRKFIELEGRLSLTNGILEFLAVQPGGRDYESLLTLTAKPSALQFALLLIGCEPGALPRLAKGNEKKGDRLQIEIAWRAGGQAHRLATEQLLLDRHTGKPPVSVAWIFTGSRFVKGFDGREVFLADSEQAFISLWDNSAIPINLSGDFGNPYQGDNQGLEVNSAVLPPADTPIKLIIRRAESAARSGAP